MPELGLGAHDPAHAHDAEPTRGGLTGWGPCPRSSPWSTATGAVVGSRRAVRRTARQPAARRHRGAGARPRGPDLRRTGAPPTRTGRPRTHDAAAGGVLQHGEEPARVRARELAEELGIDGASLRAARAVGLRGRRHPLRRALLRDRLGRPGACTPTARCVWGAWLTLAELDAHLADPAWPFVPDTRALLRGWRPTGVADYAGARGRCGRARERATAPTARQRSASACRSRSRHGRCGSLAEAAAARGVRAGRDREDPGGPAHRRRLPLRARARATGRSRGRSCGRCSA